MSDDIVTNLSLQEMIAAINDDIRVDVTSKILDLKGPVEGMCTIAAIMAYIAVVSVEDESSAMANIDNMCTFTKKLTAILMNKRDVDSIEITKH